ncbi:MAG: FliH/SctL family protein [Candidatus Brocadia sp.]
MKNKKIYISPDVKGVYVLQPAANRKISPPADYEVKQEMGEREKEKRRKEEENKIRELEAAREEAYKKGRMDAQHDFTLEIEKLRSEYASLMALFRDAVKQLTDAREKIWQESESEIIKLIVTISKKIVGYEINTNGINVVKHVVKEALSCVGEKKVVAVRLSPDDLKKVNTLEETKIMDQNIKMVEDRTITSGGCIVETNFGSVDSQMETRWEEILKAIGGNQNGQAVH